MTETAYMSTNIAVIEAWEKFLIDNEVVRQKRHLYEEQFGRGLMVNRSGFGHGTRVVGFQRFDSDKDGDRLAEGALVVSSKRGAHRGIIVPNARTKAGKAFQKELNDLTSATLDLPGMPQFHLGGDDDSIGLRSFAPALFRWEHTIYALWGCSDAPVDESLWGHSIPLSVYYTAKEKFDAKHG